MAGFCRAKRQSPCAPSRRPNRGANRKRDMDAKNEPVVTRSMSWDAAQPSREILLNREWLVTNGPGGYASGPVSGSITRKYRGILIAALAAPPRRTGTWCHVPEFLPFDGGGV